LEFINQIHADVKFKPTGPANPAPPELVTLPECSITVYLVLVFNCAEGLMLSTLLDIDVVNLTAVPVELLNSIHGLVPSFIGLLKVILTTLFSGTFTALFTGSVFVTTGAVSVVNEKATGPTIGVFAKSVTLPECRITE